MIRAAAICLALTLAAACREKRDGAAPDAGATANVDASIAAPSAQPPPIRSAPRAPTRANATCPAPKPGTTKVYASANGNDCIMRGGKPTAVDSAGRIAAHRHPASVCVDDDCTTDATCGADRVCACAGPDASTPEGHPRCIFGNCTSDADCDGFACVEATALGIPTRPSAALGVLGRYCRSRSDTCQNDAPCPNAQQGERCLFVDGAFRCHVAR